MAPEKVTNLIAIKLRIENKEILADGQTASIPGKSIYVSWYTKSPTKKQISIATGLVHVPNEPQPDIDDINDKAVPDLGGGQYKWKEPPPEEGPLMFAMALPAGRTLVETEPKPVEAKDYNGTLAVFWILPPKEQILLRWQIGELRGELIDEIRRINREGLDELIPTRAGGFEYDVALSYASEDRSYVEKVATLLKEEGVKVFYDKFEEASSWGKNLHDYLRDVYGMQARYTVMFISQQYVKKKWTQHERESAQERALQEELEYILPARFDDTPVPGLSNMVHYLPLDGRDPKNLADRIIEKLAS